MFENPSQDLRAEVSFGRNCTCNARTRCNLGSQRIKIGVACCSKSRLATLRENVTALQLVSVQWFGLCCVTISGIWSKNIASSYRVYTDGRLISIQPNVSVSSFEKFSCRTQPLGPLGQPCEVFPKFRNFITENLFSNRFLTRNFSEVLDEWEAPLASPVGLIWCSLICNADPADLTTLPLFQRCFSKLSTQIKIIENGLSWLPQAPEITQECWIAGKW